jgi:hypothetical protein
MALSDQTRRRGLSSAGKHFRNAGQQNLPIERLGPGVDILQVQFHPRYSSPLHAGLKAPISMLIRDAFASGASASATGMAGRRPTIDVSPLQYIPQLRAIH